MSTLNDKKILNAILNPNTPFEEENDNDQKISQSTYEITKEIIEAKQLELEGIKAAEANDLNRSIECFTSAIKAAPNWASSYNNRAQALRLIGNVNAALEDLNKAIDLSKHYNDNKVYGLSLAQKGTILRLNGKDEEALECFKLAAACGNKFAKQQTVCLNPYAALCNKMLTDMFEKVKSGESY